MIQWKEIEEAPNYWISNRGEVLSKRVKDKEKLIKPFDNQKTGYPQVCLIITDKGAPKKKTKTFYPHQLVAKYFVDNPNGYNRVNHKDLDKTNNHYWNLEWVSQQQNIHHYYNSDAKNKPRNMKRVEVYDIHHNYIDTFPSINQAAKEMGVAPSSVYKQCQSGGGGKRVKTYIFKYEEE